MPDPIQGVPEEDELQEAAPLVIPAGFYLEDTDEAQVERLNAVRQAELDDEKKNSRSFARRAYEATLEPIARGVTKAVDETSDAIVGLGAGIVKQAIKIPGVGTEAYKDDFLRWYQHRDEINPFKIGDEFRDEHLGGPSDTLFEGLLEGGAQFAAGFLGAGKLMAVTKLTKLTRAGTASKSLKQLLGGGRDFGKLLDGITATTGWPTAVKAAMKFSFKELAYETARGGIADFMVFDGHDQRLADMMEEHEFLQNPIQQFLLSDEDDSEFEGRMKNLLEGAMMGAAIDNFLGMIRGGRAWKRAVDAAKVGDDVKVGSNLDEMVQKIEESEMARRAQIEEVREVPKGEKAAVADNEDGTASLFVRMTDEELSQAARTADSGDIGRRGLESHDAAVIDPEDGFVGRGVSHEEATRQIAARRLGDADIESDAVSELTEELMQTITGEFDGFIEKGAPDAAFVTREATNERLAQQAATGQSEMRFESRRAAEEVGAAIEMVERARLQQRGIDATGFNPDDAAQWQVEAIKLEDAWRSGDKEAIIAATEGSSINLKHIYNSVRTKAALASLAKQYPEVGKRVQFSFDEIKRIGRDLIPEDATEMQMKTAMADIFGESENLAGQVAWMRAWTISLGNEAQKMARIFESASEQATRDLALGELTKQLDTLLDTQDLLTGTLSNIGRGLRAAAIPLGPRKIKAGKSGIEEVKGIVEKLAGQTAEAAKEGKPSEALDKQLEEAMDALAKIMGETTDEGIAGVRAADVPGPETLPRGAAEGGEQAAGEAPVALSKQERMDGLIKRADELLESEGIREADLRELEGLESATAPPTRRSVANMSKEDIDSLVRAVFTADNGEPAEILQQLLVPASRTVAGDGARFINQPELKGWAKARRAIQWYRVNAMLSGIRTHAINSASNATVAIQRPIELGLGGALHGNRETVKQAGDILVALGQNWGDHWRASKLAMRQSQGVLDPKSSHFSGSYARSQEALRGGSGSLLARIVGTPGKFLMGLDEFASQANYRANLRAGALREGRRLGKAGDELAGFVEAELRMGYGADGQAINKAARNYARENTFKAELGPAGKKFEDLINSETAVGNFLQFLMPFRKTPINITKYAWQRMPGINLLSGNYRQALSGAAGQAAKEEALGKMAVGTMMYSTAAWLFLTGRLTGDGPSDPRARKMWLAAGNKPGTVTVGGVSFEMRRLDPVLTPFVMVANLLEAAGELDEETNVEAAALMALTMAESVAERSFFTGLTEFLEAATGGNEDMFNRWIENSASSLVPNLLKQGNYDDIYREANGFVEEVLRNTMFFSPTIEVRRNLFGEPMQKPVGLGQRAVNPFTMTWGATVDEKLARELYDIGSTMSLPAEKKSFGEGGTIDLRQRGKYPSKNGGNQSPYDRWMELTASKDINGGRTLKARMVRLSETQTWKDADPVTRRKLAEKVITSSRDVAWQVMLGEYPSLRSEVIFRRSMGKMKRVTSDEETLDAMRSRFGMTEKGRWERMRDRLNR